MIIQKNVNHRFREKIFGFTFFALFWSKGSFWRQSYKRNLALKKTKKSLKILDVALPQFRLNKHIGMI